MDFKNFLTDMGVRPLGAMLDRIDNDADYSPANCRWSSRKTQNVNRRSVLMVTFNGETLCVADWARRLRRNRDLLRKRIQSGAPLEKVLVPSNGVGRHDRSRAR